MMILLLVSGSAVCVLAYRFLVPLLGQIPDRNEDFNAFFSDSESDCVSSNSAAEARHLKSTSSVLTSVVAVVHGGNR